jgi:ribose 5-phosphate isomerase B
VNVQSQQPWDKTGHGSAISFIPFATIQMQAVLLKENSMIAVGSDHGGVELKDHLIAVLRAKGIAVADCGTRGTESVDYPDFGRAVSLQVSHGEAERGLLVCTSGIGMSIIANKFPRVRAALVHDLDGARSSREHNDANILVLGGAKLDKNLARQILETWLETPFAAGRHQRRLDKISAVERELGTKVPEKR